MSTVTIAGNEIPVNVLAGVLPALAMLYLANAAYFAEDSLMGRYDGVVAKENTIVEKRNSAQELKQRSREIDKVKADIVDIEKSIAILRSKIPVDAQLPVLLYDVERMARLTRGGLDSFQPEQMAAFRGDPSGEIQEIPIAIKAKGTFSQVLQLLEQIHGYERKLSIGNLSLRPVNTSPVMSSRFQNTLAMEFKLSAYVLRNRGATP
ncbi:MAG: type 4a pilus biogenesis protein PilO [Candidatus Sericytochromatia bacterium]|nr:type 4a pilus biogenesis protein PilO [Candidatus Sericytochromatia bacterium]